MEAMVGQGSPNEAACVFASLLVCLYVCLCLFHASFVCWSVSGWEGERASVCVRFCVFVCVVAWLVVCLLVCVFVCVCLFVCGFVCLVLWLCCYWLAPLPAARVLDWLVVVSLCVFASLCVCVVLHVYVVVRLSVIGEFVCL